MTKPVLALSAWTLNKFLIMPEQGIFLTNRPLLCKPILHQPAFTSQTIPVCTRYIIDVFCCNFKTKPIRI